MVTLEDRVIIRLLVGDFEIGDPLVGRNVLAFDKDGNMLWRIPTTGVMVRDPDGSEAPEAYFNLRLNSDGETINIASPDLTYDLDPETGKLSGGRVHR
ncbi:MAG: hypothetical protein QF902_11040 [Rhodospirillales bacterium]|nr:hypothetical protein [Rhodospirillales bacterium]